MGQAKMFLKSFMALGLLILQLVGCLFITALPATKKRRSADQRVSSWTSFKKFITCKSDTNEVHDPKTAEKNSSSSAHKKFYHNIGCSGSFCSLRHVVHGNTRVMHRSETSPENSSRSSQEVVVSDHSRLSMGSSTRSLTSPKPQFSSGHETQAVGSFRGVHLRKFSGCYECHVVADQFEALSRESSLRTTLYSCPKCGEIFTKSEVLEQHQAIKHAGDGDDC